MIKNFEEVKKLLAELSEVVNKFKSEAVQLRIVELVFTGGTLPDADPAMLHDGAYRLFLVEESLRHELLKGCLRPVPDDLPDFFGEFVRAERFCEGHRADGDAIMLLCPRVEPYCSDHPAAGLVRVLGAGA
jgi:hypothetical protein